MSDLPLAADTRATRLSRRSAVQFAALGLLLPTAHSANAEVALATAINRSARFRALSQRSAKAYAQILLGVSPEAAQKTLTTVQRLFQQGFDDLAQGSYSADLVQQLATVRVETTKLVAAVSTTPKLDQLALVSSQADKVLGLANKATEMLMTTAKSTSSKIIDTAGRQRMLSQRMAKNYFLVAANVNSGAAAKEIGVDKAEFKAALAALVKAPISTSAIREELELCSAQWFLLETAIDQPGGRADSMKTVASASERVLELANSLTEKYESALKDVLGSA
jgi:hypothetical protein